MLKASLKLLAFSSILLGSFGNALGETALAETEINKMCCLNEKYCQYFEDVEPIDGSEPGKIACPDGYSLFSDLYIDGSSYLACRKKIKITCGR